MADKKELNCPFCKKNLPFGNGFEHDKDLNFICSNCKKPVFGVTEKAEKELKSRLSGMPGHLMGFSAGSRKESLPIVLNDVQEEAAPIKPTDPIPEEQFGCFA